MDLHKELMREHSKEQAVRLSQYVGDNTDRFADLMEQFFHKDLRICQRASWVVSHCADAHPQLITPYLSQLIENLDNPVHDAVKRNTLRIFQDVDLPEDLMGPLADKCFAYLNDPKEPVAMRVFSMTILYNVSTYWPEMQRELSLIIEEHMPFGTAGFKSRGNKILAKIRKNALKEDR